MIFGVILMLRLRLLSPKSNFGGKRKLQMRVNRSRLMPTLKQYLYVAYFIGHLKSLGAYEAFETEVRKTWDPPKGAQPLASFLYDQLRIGSREKTVINLVSYSFAWIKTEKGVSYWAVISNKIRPFFP